MALATALTASVPVTSYAQANLGTGALSGTVLDGAGGVIAGAEVTATNAGTGLVRELPTTTAGQFTIPVLPPGDYAVIVSHPGFALLTRDGLTVSVGRTTSLRLVLQPADVQEALTVSADTPLIDATATDESTLIDRRQINDLPINGRRADQFALLAPGVTRDSRFGLLSYRGQSGIFNNFTMEGNDANQAYFSEGAGRTRIASNVSANAIREFQVSQSNFLPEFGRSAGGGINAAIRSGTNRLSADGFYYFRNESFNARDPLASIKPAESRHQFGGSLSGPLVKDRVFYFVNYDQQKRDYPLITEDLSGVLTNGLPTNASDADRAAFSAGTALLRSKFPGGAPGNTVPRTADQNLVLGKVDATLNPTNLLSITYNYLNARAINGIQTPLVLGNVGRNGSDDVRIHSFNARLTSTLRPTVVNELRFKASRDFEFEFANQPPPQVFVGSFSFGRANFLERPALPDERGLQFIDNLSIITGSHSFKFGAEVNRVRDIIDNPSNFGGTYNYSDALTFGRDVLNPSGRTYTSYDQSFGLPGLSFSTTDYNFFAQDQWGPVTGLTVNYGVRYEFQNLPKPVAPNPAVPETQTIAEDTTAWGPRLGVAYDISRNGKTVVHSGWGMYYGRTSNGVILNALLQTGSLDPTKSTVSISLRPGDPGAPTYPNILETLPATAAGTTSVFRLDSEYRRPRLQDFNVGIDRQLGGAYAISASFVHTKGERLPVSFDVNMAAPAFTRTYQLPDGSTFDVPFSAGVTRTAGGVTQNVNLSRPNLNFGAMGTIRSIGETWYKALFFELKRRYANGYQFGIAYTLAKAENLSGTGDGGGGGSETPFGGSAVQNQFDLSSNRGAAPTDQRHRFVLNGIVNLPVGFRISGIFTAESGRPYSAIISVPNLPFTLDGAQYAGFGGLLGQGGGADRNFAPTIVRNSTYGDANYKVDLRLARDFRLGEKLVVELIAEGFNVLNRANFNGFQNTRYTATATTVTTPLSMPVVLTERTDWGRANNDGSQPDGTNARRFQLAARFRF
jgi:hypothetical protein